MNILMMLSLATGHEKPLLDALTDHRLAWLKRHNTKRLNPVSEDVDHAADYAREALLSASAQPAGASSKKQIKTLLLDLLDEDDSEEQTENLLAMLIGARKSREELDDLEVTLGRALRLAGVPNHVLAASVGMSERSASKRYKPRPKEGLSSRITRDPA